MKTGHKMPLVSERVSDEKLEDSHAFSDIVVTRLRTPSASNGVNEISASNSIILETLDEEDSLVEDSVRSPLVTNTNINPDQEKTIQIEGLHTIENESGENMY